MCSPESAALSRDSNSSAPHAGRGEAAGALAGRDSCRQTLRGNGGGAGGGGWKGSIAADPDEAGRDRGQMSHAAVVEGCKPRLLLSHIPLWRPGGVACGPRRCQSLQLLVVISFALCDRPLCWCQLWSRNDKDPGIIEKRRLTFITLLERQDSEVGVRASLSLSRFLSRALCVCLWVCVHARGRGYACCVCLRVDVHVGAGSYVTRSDVHAHCKRA